MDIKNNYTFCMLKPDATRRNINGHIISMIEDHNFKIIKIEKKLLTKEKAEKFYESHKERFFFSEMVERISSEEVIGILLEYTNSEAVEVLRKLMGATNPSNAESGTIRKKYAISIDENTIHGSDSFDNVKREAKIFFSN